MFMQCPEGGGGGGVRKSLAILVPGGTQIAGYRNRCDTAAEVEQQVENKFLSWLRSTGLAIYKDNFNRSGYDDVDLLKMLDEGEEKAMFDVLGINVPGHVVKLQKCLQKLRSDACHSGSTESGLPSQSAVKDQQPAKMHKVESRQASEYLQVQYL